MGAGALITKDTVPEGVYAGVRASLLMDAGSDQTDPLRARRKRNLENVVCIGSQVGIMERDIKTLLSYKVCRIDRRRTMDETWFGVH